MRKLLLGLLLAFCLKASSQDQAAAVQIDNALDQAFKAKTTIVKDPNDSSSVAYLFNKTSHQLISASATYSNEKKLYNFYYNNNELVKIKVWISSADVKQAQKGIYYLNNGALVDKSEMNFELRDIEGVIKLGNSFLAKSQGLYK